MEEFDLGYFKKTNVVRKEIEPRLIEQMCIAWELDENFYDGKRHNGYGGFKNDGRWDSLFQKLILRYKIPENGTIVDIGCKKGFILESAIKLLPNANILGIENHPYPIKVANPSIKIFLKESEYWKIPLKDGSVDFLISFSSIYMQNLGHIIKTLKEIQRVANGRSYVTLGCYRSVKEKNLWDKWNLVGTCLFTPEDWYKILNYAGYTGDIFFTTPEELGLC